MPGLVHEVLRQARSGKLRVETSSSEISRLRLEMRRSNQRLVLAVVGAGLVLAATVLLGLDGGSPARFAGAPALTWILGGLGAYMILAAWPGDD